MTQDQFYRWLENPSEMNFSSIADIRDIIRRYPYFQAAQVMLAKNLKQENHIDQLNQLQLAAIMVPNRKQLHAYLHGKVAVKAISVDDEPVSGPTTVDSEQETVLVPEIIERSSLYDLIPEPIVYQLEKADLPDLVLPTVAKNPVFVPQPEALTFSEWLSFIETEDLRAETSSIRQVQDTESQPTKSKIDIIDHFLAQQSTGVKKRAEFFNPQKVGAKSTLEDFTVVSETLARIYFEQEKYELARQAYQALGLKYPEKSVYFAARLKEIDEKLNTEN